FFQAEDGIRDKLVTGVQTCALPILSHHVLSALESRSVDRERGRDGLCGVRLYRILAALAGEKAWANILGTVALRGCSLSVCQPRSEERRVGKECGARAWRHAGKKRL